MKRDIRMRLISHQRLKIIVEISLNPTAKPKMKTYNEKILLEKEAKGLGQ